MRSLLLLVLFILVGCNDSLPKLSDLGATNINNDENIGFQTDSYEIASPDVSLTISGRCDPRHKFLEVSFDGQNWADVKTKFDPTASDLNCLDGNFSFVLPKVGDFVTFETGVAGNQEKFIQIRGDLGFTKTSTRTAKIRSGDFTPPGAPKFNTISDYVDPKIRLTKYAEDNDIAYYQCRLNEGDWFQCFNAATPLDSVASLPGLTLGQEVFVSVRAVDTSGNVTPAHQILKKSVRRGQIGRGFDGEVKGVVKIADDRYLAYGNFNYYEAEVARGFARLSPEGVFDPSFQIGYGINSGAITDFEFDSLGNIFLVGSFTEYLKRANPRITKLLPSGEFHSNFATNSGFSATATPTRIEHEGNDSFRIDFLKNTTATNYKGSSFTGNSLRINGQGVKDSTFVCPASNKYLYNILRISSGNYAILSSDLLPTYKSATLAHYDSNCIKQNDILTYNDVSISQDGSTFYDHTHYSATGWAAFTNIFSLNNKLYLGGNFNSITKNSTPYSIQSGIAEFQLEENQAFSDSGLILPTVVSVGTSPNNYLRIWDSINPGNEQLIYLYNTGSASSYYLDSNQQMVAYDNQLFASNSPIAEYSGRLYGVNSRIKVINKMSRAVDTTFDGVFNRLNLIGVNQLKFQNNHLYVAGSFTRIRNLTKQSTNLILIDSNGNLVRAYTGVGKTNALSSVNTIIPYGDRYLVAGDFEQMLGTTRKNFAVLKLKADHSLEVDALMPNIATLNGEINHIAVDSAQNIYLAGTFTSPKRGILKILSSGSIDSSFQAYGASGSSSYANVYALAIVHNKIYLSVPNKFLTDLGVERNCSSILVINTNGEFQNCTTTTTSATSMRVIGDRIIMTQGSVSNLSDISSFDHTQTTPTASPLIHSTTCPGYFANYLFGSNKMSVHEGINSIFLASGKAVVQLNKNTLACEKITPLVKEGSISGLFQDQDFLLAYGNYTVTENGKSHHSLAKLFQSSGNFVMDTKSFGDEH